MVTRCYDDRKKRRLAQLQRLTVLLPVLLIVLVGALADWLAPSSWWAQLLSLTDRGATAEKRAQAIGQIGIAPLLMIVPSLLACFGVAWKSRKWVARMAFERLFDSFDDQHFAPVIYPTPSLDGHAPLPWIAPTAGTAAPARLKLWTDLHLWVGLGAAPPDRGGMAFSWAVLVGRPGAGKSRTADEFARSLARRDMLGDHAPLALARKTRLVRARLQAGAWWRRALQRPAPGDPWDAGRLVTRQQGGPAVNLRNSPEYQADLNAWRPRAPTLIVFEDPHDNEAATLIPILAGNAKHYRFPVRLLIVNQTLPMDLDFVPSAGLPMGLGSKLPGLKGGPWLVDEAGYLTWPEWTELKAQRFARDDPRGWACALPEEFNRVTAAGNPLLVESLVHWLQAQPARREPPDLSGVTSAVLLQDRAHRVKQALTIAGLGTHGDWTLLAAAALVGGLPRSGDDRDGLGDPLQRVFPNEDVQQRIPPLRPDLIGLAFAGLVVETPVEDRVLPPAAAAVQQATLHAIASLAWRRDAFAVLAALTRLSDGMGSAADDGNTSTRQRLVLALLAQTTQASSIGALPLPLAVAYMRFHLAYGTALDAVRQRVAALSPAQALQLAAEEVPLALAQPGAAARDALAVFSLAAARALARPGPALDALLRALLKLAAIIRPRGELQYMADAVPMDGIARLGALLGQRLRRGEAAESPSAADMLVQLAQCPLMDKGVLRDFAEALAQALGSDSRDASAIDAASAVAAFRLDIPLLRTLSDAAAGLRSNAGSTLAALDLQARVLARTANVQGQTRGVLGAHEAERMADLIGRIARNGPSLPTVEAQVLAERQADAFAAAAHAHGETGIAEGAHHAERLAGLIGNLGDGLASLPLAAQLALAAWQADAWVSAAHAHSQIGGPEGANAAEHLARRIGRLADRFAPLPAAERRVLAERQALACSHAAHAQGVVGGLDGGHAAERLAGLIGTLADGFVSLPAADRRVMAQRQAEAWAHAAHAHSKTGLIEGAHEAERLAGLIGALADRFAALPAAERRFLAERQAEAWARAAYAQVQAGSATGAREAERLAGLIGKLARSFASLPVTERRVLAEWQAYAWAAAADPHADIGSTEGACEAERLAGLIGTLAQGFSSLSIYKRRMLAEQQALALAHAGSAHRLLRSVEGAQAAERVAGLVRSLVNGFALLPIAERLVLAECQASAWTDAAIGHGSCNDHASWARCAQQVHLAGVPWAGRRDQPDWLQRLLRTTSRAEPKRPAG